MEGTTTGLPAVIPADSYVDPEVIAARRGSVYTQTTLSGLEYLQRSAGTIPGPESLLLVPEDQSVAFATYSFPDNIAEDNRLMLAIELTPALPQTVYFGIADYAISGWHWVTVDDPRATTYLGFPEEMQPISPGGQVHAIVLVEAGTSASISGLTLHRDVIAPPPVNLTASYDNPWPDRVVLNWDDPAQTYPGLSYESILIEWYSPPGDNWLEVVTLPAGTTTFEDFVDRRPYGTSVDYRLRTVADSTAGPPGAVAKGQRQLKNELNLNATKGDFPDRIRLTWDDAPGAEIYYLEAKSGYQSMDWQLLYAGTATAIDHHRDDIPEHPIGFGEFEEYAYRIKAKWSFRETPLSGDYGFRSLPVVQNVQASEGTYPDKNVITWDPVPGATGYVIWYDHHLGGIPERPWVMDLVEGGDVTSYSHLPGIPGIAECYYDHTYSYGVSAQWNGDYFWNWYEGTEDDGYRVIQPPTEISASDDAFSDRIRLTWEKAVCATGYLIYRDNMDPASIVATVGDVDTWDDTTVPDSAQHTYWIRSLWTEHTSAYSEPDTGSASLFVTYATGLPFTYSVALVDNKPVGLYAVTEGDTRTFYYARSAVELPTGSGDWSSHVITSGLERWIDCDVCEVGGKPAIAYSVDETNEVHYAFSDTVTPALPQDWQHTMLEQTEYTGGEFNVEEINGNPAVVYRDMLDLRYAFATVAQPLSDTDWQISQVTSDGWADICLLEKSNLPVVMYGGTPRLATAPTATPAPTGDWSHSWISNIDCEHNSLSLNGNTFVASFADFHLGDLHFAQATVPDPAGVEDWISHIVVSDGHRITQNCTAIIDGKPVIAYLSNDYTGDNGSAVMLAIAATANPQRAEDWEQRVVAESADNYPYYGLALLVQGNKPLIFYLDVDTGDVVYSTFRD